jgi:hypothetical protein
MTCEMVSLVLYGTVQVPYGTAVRYRVPMYSVATFVLYKYRTMSSVPYKYMYCDLFLKNRNLNQVVIFNND